MRDNVDMSEEKAQECTSLFRRTLGIATKIDSFTTSKNASEAILVAIAKNLDLLEKMDNDQISNLYQATIGLPEFSEEAMKEGLGAQEKVKNRIIKAINCLSRG